MRKLIVPNNLNIKKLVARYGVGKIPAFHKDYIYLVCNAIISGLNKLDGKRMQHPQKSEPYYVPLCSEILKELIGDKYSLVLDWMICTGIIECDNHFIVGVVSKGYRFTSHYQNSGKRWITVTNKYLMAKDVAAIIDNGYNFLPRVVQRLEKWFHKDKLKIDAKTAYEVINQIEAEGLRKAKKSKNKIKKIQRVRAKACQYRNSVRSIDEGEYRISRDSGFGYRVFTPITKLSKKFRSLVTYDGKPLVEIDIVASQLFFSTFLLNYRYWLAPKYKTSKPYLHELWDNIQIQKKDQTITNTNNNTIDTKKESYNTITLLKNSETLYGYGFQEHAIFQNYYDAGIYESVVSKLDEIDFFPANFTPKKKRKKVKKTLLKQLFSNPTDPEHWHLLNGQNRAILGCFEALYPEVMKVYQPIKQGYYKDLCSLMQRIESISIIGFVCKRMQAEYPDIPIFILHDCIVTTEGNELLVKEVMKQGIQEFIGYAPKFDVKYWSGYNELISPYIIESDNGELLYLEAIEQFYMEPVRIRA